MQTDCIDIVPLLACSDIAAEHDFLVRVLGFASGGLTETYLPRRANDRFVKTLGGRFGSIRDVCATTQRTYRVAAGSDREGTSVQGRILSRVLAIVSFARSRS